MRGFLGREVGFGVDVGSREIERDRARQNKGWDDTITATRDWQ